jgi:hypothetical protein
MGLFYEILSSINDPNREGSVEQLGSIVNSVRQLADNYGVDASTMQTVMSTVGKQMRSALKQESSEGTQQLGGLLGNIAGGGIGQLGQGQLGNLGNLVGGSNFNMAAIESLIPAQLRQQMVLSIAQKTGMNLDSIKDMLPTLIPTVLNLLKMGASNSGAPNINNPLLQSFLDSDGDGDTDLGDVLKFANRFLNPA